MNTSNRSPAHPRRQCTALTRRGEPCRMAPLAGADRCFTHALDKAPDRAKARRRGGQARRTPHLYAPGPVPDALRDVGSIQVVLERTVHETLAQANGHERSRAIGALLMIALKALEVGELEERLDALEQRTGTLLRVV